MLQGHIGTALQNSQRQIGEAHAAGQMQQGGAIPCGQVGETLWAIKISLCSKSPKALSLAK